MKKNRSGSIIYIVLLSVVIAVIILTSVVSLISTQRKLNLRKEILLKGYSIAESGLNNAYSAIINNIQTKGSPGQSALVPKGADTYKAFTFADSQLNFMKGFIQTPQDLVQSYDQVQINSVEVHVLPVTPLSGSHTLDEKDPAYSLIANKQPINDQQVPMISKVVISQANISYTVYLRNDVNITSEGLFKDAIFFSGQLQLHRGYRPMGSIHANGDLLLNSLNGDKALYNGAISSSGHIYRGATMSTGGTGINAYGYTAVLPNGGGLDFSTSTNPYAPTVNPVASGNSNDLMILTSSTTATTATYSNFNPTYQTSSSTPQNPQYATFDSRSSNWKDQATALFNGNLEDKSHNVPVLTPTGSQGYTLDSASTANVNEFNNGPYSIIEPLFPKSIDQNLANPTHNANNLEGKASLILRVEADTSWTPKDANGQAIPTGSSTPVANYTDQFVVRAYKYAGTYDPATATGDPVLTPVPLPSNVVGIANSALTGIQTSARAEAYNYSTLTKTVTGGLHDSRLGRGVQPITIDVAALKNVLESNLASVSDPNNNGFYSNFNPSTDWSGLLYVEFPTSVAVDSTKTVNSLPATGTSGAPITTQPYQYGTPALLHPDRAANYDNEGRANRTDGIIPIAPQLNQYPALSSLSSSIPDSTLQLRQYAIPALQLINGGQLPNPGSTNVGFSVATNAPLYVVGNYNSDGIITASDVSNSSPTNFAQPDPGEIPAALYSDSLTILSNQWPLNRPNSFPGGNGASNARQVTTPVEIGASIATGEYPIFEFFTHALESYQNLYNSSKTINPIVIKGSVVGMFHSEIQHFKQAYGRSYLKNIETYYSGHGNSAIPSIRFTQSLEDGNVPPGTPTAFVFSTINYRMLNPNNSADAAVIKTAGF